LNDPALAGEARWRHTDVPPKVPGQVGLIGETHRQRRGRDVAAGTQERPGLVDPALGQVSVRRQADVAAEGAGQGEGAASGDVGQFVYRRRVDQTLVEQRDALEDVPRAGIRRRRAQGRARVAAH
jgi:hypothetical protein